MLKRQTVLSIKKDNNDANTKIAIPDKTNNKVAVNMAAKSATKPSSSKENSNAKNTDNSNLDVTSILSSKLVADTVRVANSTLAPSPIAPSPLFVMCMRYPVLSTCANELVTWDTSLCIHINRYSNNDKIATTFKTISRLGDGWFWYAMLALSAVIGLADAIIPLITTVLVSLLGLVIYKLLKVKTVRPRPYQVHQVIVLGERPLDVFSFPSGHTLQAVLFTTTLGSYYPILMTVMFPFMVLVALSRMVLGLHYPTDVLIGAGIGYGLSLFAPTVHHALEALIF